MQNSTFWWEIDKSRRGLKIKQMQFREEPNDKELQGDLGAKKQTRDISNLGGCFHATQRGAQLLDT